MLSSTSSLSSSTHGALSTPNITRTYKQASQLFLTRRVPEALQTLEPIIQPQPVPPSSDSASAEADDVNGHDTHDPLLDESTYGTDGTASSSAGDSSHPLSDAVGSTSQTQAPIATASRGARVKVWSLYISMLNSIVEMGADEGRKAFGTATRWKELVKNVRDGTVWEDVVRWGYGGNEGAVDADVVGNLATLLLAHAPSQTLTQSRLETYLSSTSGMPNASALASQIERSSASSNFSSANGHGLTNGTTAHNNGTSTPRDLGSRLKILEIYTLHVLPRNEEWDYAKEFINMSEVLDDERREAFVNALEGLREEHSVEGRRQKELEAQRQREKDAEEERIAKEKEAADQRQREREAEEQQQQQQQQRRQQSSKSSGTSTGTGSTREGVNEVDYGVDKRRPNGSLKGSKHTVNGAVTGSSSASAGAKGSSTQRNPGAATKKSSRSPPPTLYKRAALLFAALQQSLLNLGVNISKHPVAVLRMVLFLFALVMALARQDVRQRIANARDTAWEKIRKTVGMGVKVSYI